MKKSILLLLFAPLFITAQDSFTVVAHDKTNMVWNQRYDSDGVDFNLDEKSISEANMSFTLGCSSNQCSDWDYTVRVFAGLEDGTLDSTVNVIDTLSFDPIVTDTTWNYSPHFNYTEIGRLITPYGSYMNVNNGGYGTAGFDENWTHTYDFDVADYIELLRQDPRIRIYYDGWQDGFSATIEFDFTEGVPARQPIKVENVQSGFTYTNETEVESGPLAPRKIFIEPGTTSARLNVWYSGHGIDNDGCAEFCERSYNLYVDESLAATQSLWRDDCGLNPLAPQGGTWIFNRGNWCPGDKIHRFSHELTPFISPGDSLEINFDLFPHYGSTNEASFNLEVQLVTYGPSNFADDVAIVDISAPSSKDAHLRKNPTCGQPSIIIKNNGSNVLNSCWINYGIEGSVLQCFYEWTGNLKYDETEEISLPRLNWFGIEDNPTFYAQVGLPDGNPDGYGQNNRMTSLVENVAEHTDPFNFVFRTNDQPQENSWKLYDGDGTEIDSGDDFEAGTEYEVEMDLDSGCYTFVFSDYDPEWGGGDGLSWWYNSQQGYETSGTLRMTDESGATIRHIEPDFGSEFRYNFTVNYVQGNEPFFLTCGEEPPNFGAVLSGVEDFESGLVNIYPNPNSGTFTIDLGELSGEASEVEIYNINGQVVYQNVLNGNPVVSMKENLHGLFYVKISSPKIQPMWLPIVVE